MKRSSPLFLNTAAPSLSRVEDSPASKKQGRPRPRVTALVLVVTDLLALALAGTLTHVGWLFVSSPTYQSEVIVLWPLLFVFVLGYAAVGLYPATGIGPVEELRRLSNVTTAVYLMLGLILYLTGNFYARGFWPSAWGCSLLLVPAGRAALRHGFARSSWWGSPLLVLGAAKTGQLLIERFHNQPGLGLKVLACLDDDITKHGNVKTVPVMGPLALADELATKWNIRHALIAMPGVDPAELNEVIKHYTAVFPNLIIVPNLFGISSLGLGAHDLGGIVGLHVKQNLLLPLNRLLKRVLDLLLLVPLLVISLPIVCLAALWIVIVSPGNPFYAQIREGYGGREIKIFKLRTMFPNADVLLEGHFAKYPETKLEWETFYKLKRDPRILPGIGQFLRKTSLDELPQLWNIFVGEMSFVGPRPFPYYHLEHFGKEFRTLRSSVPPGLTGLWQVSARSDGDVEVQEALDSHYIRNWSLWMDIYLIARTPFAVLMGKGAY